jgi:hypothetical protein
LQQDLLSDNIDLGVFEYGIRDLKHAIPDEVCNLVQPVGVVYTNVSREHSIVAGVLNPFDNYLKGKRTFMCTHEKWNYFL